MTPEERYLFDLQGYLLVQQVLSVEMLGRLNTTINEMEFLTDAEVEAMGIPRRPTESDTYARAGVSSGRLGDYTCDILKHGGVFEELIDWPPILSRVDAMIGDPYCLDAAILMSRHRGGAFRFHHGYAELLPYSEYACSEGDFSCVSVKISYVLTDVGVEDGCFAVLPGSNKSNFQNPLVGQIPDPDHPLVKPIPCRAGDAIIFSEDLSHGAVQNRGCRTRRTLFYSYAPVFHCSWEAMAETAPGFQERATSRQRELTRVSTPFWEALPQPGLGDQGDCRRPEPYPQDPTDERKDYY